MPVDIPAKELLAHDTACIAENSLSDSFGDSYLVKHNAPFRRLREKALSLGTQYSQNPSFIEIYKKTPLLCLEDILESNVVPYAATSHIVRSALQAQPDLSFQDLMVSSRSFSNYVAHESAHCIAHQSLFVRNQRFSHSLIRDLLSEAVAFCADFHCTRGAFDKPIEECLVFLNCYPLPQQKHALYERLRRFLSASEIHRFLVHSYVGVLLSPENLDDYSPVLNSITTAAGLSEFSSTMHSELLLFYESLHGITTGFREDCVPLTFKRKGLHLEYENLVRLNRLNASYVLQEHSEEIAATALLLDSLFGDL